MCGQGGHFLVADTTPLGLKGLECAKMLLTHAKVRQSSAFTTVQETRREAHGYAKKMYGKGARCNSHLIDRANRLSGVCMRFWSGFDGIRNLWLFHLPPRQFLGRPK